MSKRLQLLGQMSSLKWTDSTFRLWLGFMEMRYKKAAELLELSERTVMRMAQGQKPIRRCEIFACQYLAMQKHQMDERKRKAVDEIMTEHDERILTDVFMSMGM